MSDPTALREAAQALVIFAGRFSAGDSDVQREDLQVAIDDLRDALAAPPVAPSEDAAWKALYEALSHSHLGVTDRAVIARHRPRIEEAIRAAAGDGGLDVERLLDATDALPEDAPSGRHAELYRAGWDERAQALRAALAHTEPQPSFCPVCGGQYSDMDGHRALAHTESATDGSGEERLPSRDEFSRMSPREVNRFLASRGLSVRVRDEEAGSGADD